MAAAPAPFHFGFYYDEAKDKANRKASLDYGGERHILLFGVNGAGKSTRILIENLVTIKNRSLVVFDMKGELAAQTHRRRRQLSDVRIVNPYNVHELGSDGYNPLLFLDPADDEFFDKAKLLTEAAIESEGETNPFFPRSARGWFCAGIMWEVQQARRENRPPSLLRAREWCLQPDEWGPGPDADTEMMVKGVTVNAKRAVIEGGRQLANLAGRFARDSLEKSDHDILATLATETEFLISNPIARDLEAGNWSFAQLRQKPTTVYIVLPPDQVNDKRRWTRMLMTVALCEHLKPGPLRTLFILDEFRVSIGHLDIVNEFWALVRGYGVQVLPVCQSVLQLRALFGQEWENYAGQAECVATIGPPGDLETAEWMSRRTGNRTIWQKGWSTNEGTNMQGGAGTSSAGETRAQVARAHRLPQELMNIRVGTGRIWTAGMGDRTTPFFAPNYWQRPEVAALVDVNPYRTDAHTPLQRITAAFDQGIRTVVNEKHWPREVLNLDRFDQWKLLWDMGHRTALNVAREFAVAGLQTAGSKITGTISSWLRHPLRSMAGQWKREQPKTRIGRFAFNLLFTVIAVPTVVLWLLHWAGIPAPQVQWALHNPVVALNMAIAKMTGH